MFDDGDGDDDDDDDDGGDGEEEEDDDHDDDHDDDGGDDDDDNDDDVVVDGDDGFGDGFDNDLMVAMMMVMMWLGFLGHNSITKGEACWPHGSWSMVGLGKCVLCGVQILTQGDQAAALDVALKKRKMLAATW